MLNGPPSEWGRLLGLRFEEEIRNIGEGEGEETVNKRRKSWSENVAFMYKLSRTLIVEGLERLRAKERDGVSPDRLGPKVCTLTMLPQGSEKGEI
jgi:hypothetical protein